MDVDGNSCHGTDGQRTSTATQEDNQNVVLKQILERTTQLSHQVNGLSQAVTSIVQGDATQAPNPSKTFNQVPPPTTVPEQPSYRPKRIGPPGTFRDPVPATAHRPQSKTEFHVSLRSLLLLSLY
jgi:hypothetical protein